MNTSMKELNISELEQVAGGNIISDAACELAKLTCSVATDYLQYKEKEKMRVHNSSKINRAAIENGVESRYIWVKGLGWVKRC